MDAVLRRLRRGAVGGGPGRAGTVLHKWTIDKLGNRTAETKTASGGATATSNYTYAAGAQPHGVRTVTTGSKVDTYGYDATGNLTTRMGQTLEWDAESNLAKVTEGRSGSPTSTTPPATG